MCVYMDQLETVHITVCACRSAPVLLVQLGLFPCAPISPTLAVSIDMLEFVSELFVHVSPNDRAWAATLEKYLKTRGHVFKAKDSLRRRFSNALLHYQILVRLVNAELEKVLDHYRTSPPSHQGATASQGGSSPSSLLDGESVGSHSSTSCHHEPHPPSAEQSTPPTMTPSPQTCRMHLPHLGSVLKLILPLQSMSGSIAMPRTPLDPRLELRHMSVIVRVPTFAQGVLFALVAIMLRC